MKPLYGHQEGAVFGYNPQKQGRPSHVYHPLCCAGLHQMFGMVRRSGNETARAYLLGMLGGLGDCPAICD